MGWPGQSQPAARAFPQAFVSWAPLVPADGLLPDDRALGERPAAAALPPACGGGQTMTAVDRRHHRPAAAGCRSPPVDDQSEPADSVPHPGLQLLAPRVRALQKPGSRPAPQHAGHWTYNADAGSRSVHWGGGPWQGLPDFDGTRHSPPETARRPICLHLNQWLRSVARSAAWLARCGPTWRRFAAEPSRPALQRLSASAPTPGEDSHKLSAKTRSRHRPTDRPCYRKNAEPPRTGNGWRLSVECGSFSKIELPRRPDFVLIARF